MSVWICKGCIGGEPCKLDLGNDQSEPEICPFGFKNPKWNEVETDADCKQHENNC